MGSIFFNRVIDLHKLALKVVYISIGLSLLGLLVQGCSSLRLCGILGPQGGGAEYISYMTLGGGILALVWLRWSLRVAERLPVLNESNPDDARASYDKIWRLLEVFGILITAFALVMTPLLITTLTLGLPGLASNFAICSGSWLYFRARKLNREIREGKATGAFAGEPAKGGDARNPVLKQAGIIPLTVASLLLFANVSTEFSFLNQIRAIPSFYAPHSTLDSSTSLGIVFSGLIDVAFGGTIGLAMLVYAIKIRRSLPKRRLLIITIVTVMQFALVSGTAAPVLARWLGPSQTGLETLKQMNQATKTVSYLKKLTVPKGFLLGSSDYAVEVPNAGLSLFTEQLAAPIHEATCTKVIEYAVDLGASRWIERSNMNTGEVSATDTAVEACELAMESYPHLKVPRMTVVSSEFILAGLASSGAHSPIKFALTFYKQGTQSQHPNTVNYTLEISTTYGENPIAKDGGLSKGTTEINDLLVLIAQERLAAPDRNPTDPAFIREILKGYQHKIRVKVFETKPGVANRLEVTDSDGDHICLAIDPWDEAKQGVPDPGFGYGLGYQENLKVLSGFGNAVTGGCS
jgi:hypothetical protein